MAALPDAIRAMVELSPIEDVMLHVLREGLPGIAVNSLIADDQHFPLVLVRRLASFGNWGGDERFTDQADIAVHCFVEDPDGDEDAALLSEAVRVALRNAWRRNAHIPGRGYLVKAQMVSAPRRATDWATSTGPVQYADLPTRVHRYETQYRLTIRKERSRPLPFA
ncbi:hypothetical protein AB0J80_36060 [Actinoplanes sp. NPDC049548]|uniref:hypothetical protein n=1 Tax=Actinoplanes sp. NPDC049548 TaxID=3155152 RepID=UPI0034215E7E